MTTAIVAKARMTRTRRIAACWTIDLLVAKRLAVALDVLTLEIADLLQQSNRRSSLMSSFLPERARQGLWPEGAVDGGVRQIGSGEIPPGQSPS